MSFLGKWRRMLLGISANETTFARRGFTCADSEVQARLERIGQTFLEGYHAALEEAGIEALSVRLNAVEAERRGFAFEGAAMALALLDGFMPWKKSRLAAFIKGPGSSHVYMAHVGFGWAMARGGRLLDKGFRRLDPVLRWLAFDGYGFHQGYFHWRRYVDGKETPGSRFAGFARRVFDQGLGRSLWFVKGADVVKIASTIESFPASRHADLWGGIGLACAYAGAASQSALERLCESAGPFRSCMAVGAAFAAKARQRAGNLSAHTELASRIVCGLNAEEAARLTDAIFDNLPEDGEAPAYEVWRTRLQERFS